MPVLYHFPPKGRWTNDDMIDYQNLVPMDAEAMANFISYRTEIEVTLSLISLLNLLAIFYLF